jgi:hypothetical protein
MKRFSKIITTAAFAALVPTAAMASSHREAPAISNDPVADNTDLYAWVSPGAHDKLFVIANYIPLEEPAGGPNFFQLSEEVRYEIHIYKGDNLQRDFVTYRIEFQTSDFPRGNPGDPTANPIGNGLNFFAQISGQTQTYKVTRIDQNGAATVIGQGLAPAPNNIGPDTNQIAYGIARDGYGDFSNTFIHNTSDGGRVFVGPRDDAFYVDLGGVFDLANILPPAAAARGGRANPVDNVAGYNTHAIALEIETADLFGGAVPTVSSNDSVLGIWASAARRKVSVLKNNGQKETSGPFVQVSRLGLPLVNEVVIGLQDKDRWNATTPDREVALFAGYYDNPVIVRDAEAVGIYAALGLNQQTIDSLKSGRAAGILNIVSLTGGGIALTQLGDVLRVNVAVDSQFPNGRALQGGASADQEQVDVTDVLSSVFLANATSGVSDNVNRNDKDLLPVFPFLPVPHEGFGEGHGVPAP